MKDAQHVITRQEVLALLLAREAEREQAIQDYRHEFLRDSVIEVTDVPFYLQLLDAPVHARLKKICTFLAQRYRWTEEQAQHFVLTGTIPASPPVFTATLEKSALSEVLDRLVLIVDPLLAPEQVAKLYRTVRQPVRKRRARTMSQKHVYLAYYALRLRPYLPWSQMMDHWNQAYPDWAYKEASNFGRDCNVALRAILPLKTARSVSVEERFAAMREELAVLEGALSGGPDYYTK